LLRPKWLDLVHPMLHILKVAAGCVRIVCFKKLIFDVEALGILPAHIDVSEPFEDHGHLESRHVDIPSFLGLMVHHVGVLVQVRVFLFSGSFCALISLLLRRTDPNEND